jgi:hypothetical protein
MDSSNSSAPIGVFLPNFPLAAGDLLRAIEHSGSVTATSTDDAGEYYAMAMATVVPAESVQEGAIIVIPLTIPRPDEVLDFTFVAAADCMYVQLHSLPQLRRTYGHCAAYSADAPDQPLAIGAVFKFATVGSFIVAKQQLAASVRAIRAFENESELGQTPDKRQCVRQQEVLGELTDEAGGRPKGMSIYLLDLNGKKLYTRNKSDIAQREEDLGFVFRAMDITKMDYSITTDLVLQAEVYRSMLCEQGDTRAEERHEAFISCGLISRIQGLKVFSKFEKLKLLLIGSVLKEGATDATLSLEDFITGEKLSSKPFPCPSNNAGLVSVLKNLQTVLQIVFSDEYADCLDGFIEKLEGALRPMELVSSDFMKHSVELTLRKIFRIIRSVKSSAIPDVDLQGPAPCSKFFTFCFQRLSDDLSDHAIMTKQDAYYRVKVSRQTGVIGHSKVETPASKPEKQSVKFAEIKSEEKPGAPAKVCSGHFGKQLAAVRKDGRPYACGFGKECTFVHMSVSGKSEQKLMEVAASMPSPMKQDMVRAIQARK